MKLVKVYNIKKFMEIELKENNLTTFGVDESLVIISNEDGKSFIINSEGVADIVDSLSETITIKLTEKQEEDSMTVALFPSYGINVPVSKILEKCEFEEKALGEFIRVFGDRLEQNYATIIRAMKPQLGLNGEEYDNGRLYK